MKSREEYNLLHDEPRVINLGQELYTQSLEEQELEAIQVNWLPPAFGDVETAHLLDVLEGKFSRQIAQANALALGRICEADPVLTDILPAREALPLEEKTILHPGPPLEWERLPGLLSWATIEALLFEGYAESPAEAEALAASGEITIKSCHEYAAVVPMAGVISPSMLVYCVENSRRGNRAYCSLNEAILKHRDADGMEENTDLLVWGTNRLHRLAEQIAPTLQSVIRPYGGLSLKPLMEEALLLGDDCHNRSKAARSLLYQELAGRLLNTDQPRPAIRNALGYIALNAYFFLNLAMAAAKSAVSSLSGVELSTLITAMGSNGREFGITIAGLDNQWFTAPAEPPQGRFDSGFSEKDGSAFIGHSGIMEIYGLGRAAIVAAPMLTRHWGGSIPDLRQTTMEAYDISAGRHNGYSIPALDFGGAPAGIDLRKVLEKSSLPGLNYPILHREPGRGRIGYGQLKVPKACFTGALAALAEKQGCA